MADQFDAAIFDLDGVVTRTASLHAAAWKRVFDDFLEEQGQPGDTRFRPFDIETDYRATVDGKPRYQGVRDFLKSRAINIPAGTGQDPPGQATVCGLGKRKNLLFLQLLKDRGVEVDPSTVAFVRSLRARGVPTALVTSSRNGAAIVAAAAISDLFDAVIDGNEAERLGLRGKPEPDTLIEAARRIGSNPSRTLLVEDAVAGLRAGRAGGMGLIVGLGSAEDREALHNAGADRVVEDLGELETPPTRAPLPDANRQLGAIAQHLAGRPVALFLDYDGTLTPIVERPELANLTPNMRALLSRLADICIVAVISGRGLDDIKARVGLPGLYYAGSHGFEIEGPGLRHDHPDAAAALGELDRLEPELESGLSGIAGVIVERKRYGIAVHYRMVDSRQVPFIDALVEKASEETDLLRRRHGKKVFELVPSLPWDKGRAVLWLLEALAGNETGLVPIYIGDDRTDEDAFAALAPLGIGILVAGPNSLSRASYRLSDPEQVGLFLERLVAWLEASR